MAPILSRLSAGGGGGFGFGKKKQGGDPAGPFTTSGGIEITNGGYKHHVFLGPGPQPFTVTGDPGSATILVVAAGGSGGAGWDTPGIYAGGGGGAGGIAYASSLTISAGEHTVIAGSPAPNTAGGTGRGGTDAPQESGGYSTFGHNGTSADKPYGVIVGGGTPGGQGGNVSPNATADSASPSPAGGSTGGGGARNNYVGQGGSVTPLSASGWTFYANAGSPADPTGNPNASAAGGGGAGGAGQAPPTNGRGGIGGVGNPFPAFAAPLIAPAIPAPVQPNWTPIVGPTGIYGGGGYGACQSGDSPPNINDGSTAGYNSGGGGTGGGGPSSYPYSGFNGLDYTGGGGGGSAGNRPLGSTNTVGGRGIVIVRVAV